MGWCGSWFRQKNDVSRESDDTELVEDVAGRGFVGLFGVVSDTHRIFEITRADPQYASRSIAAASATADAESPGGGFAREKHMLVHGRADRVAVSAHGGIGQCSALPRHDVLTPGGSTQGDEPEDHKNESRFHRTAI